MCLSFTNLKSKSDLVKFGSFINAVYQYSLPLFKKRVSEYFNKKQAGLKSMLEVGCF